MQMALTNSDLAEISQTKVRLSSIPVILCGIDARIKKEFPNSNELFWAIKNDNSIIAFRFNTEKPIDFAFQIPKVIKEEFQFQINFDFLKCGSRYHFCFPMDGPTKDDDDESRYWRARDGWEFAVMPSRFINDCAADADNGTVNYTKTFGGYNYKNRLTVIEESFHGAPVRKIQDLEHCISDFKKTCAHFARLELISIITQKRLLQTA